MPAHYLDRYALAILPPAIGRYLALSDGQLGLLSGTTFGIFFALMGMSAGSAPMLWRRIFGGQLA
jgi:hypothetical protein